MFLSTVRNRNYFRSLMILIITLFLIGSIIKTDAFPYIRKDSFKDLEDSYAKWEIETLVSAGILSGFQDGTFRPHEEMTRAQLAKVLALCLGLDEDEEEASRFTDIPDDAWYRGYVGALVKSGIVRGSSSIHFSPDGIVTWEELVTFFIRAFGLEEKTNEVPLNIVDFEEYQGTSQWAWRYVALALEMGLLEKTANPRPSRPFHPQEPVERQQLAKFAYELYYYKEQYRDLAFSLYKTIKEGTIAGFTEDSSRVMMENGEEYPVAISLQRSLFHPSNREALAGVPITYVLDYNNEMIAMNRIVLRVPRDLGVLNGRNAVIDGDVILQGNNIKLENMIIEGDLVIDDPGVTDFKMKSVFVKGKLFIHQDVNLGNIEIEKCILQGIEIHKKGIKAVVYSSTIDKASVLAEGMEWMLKDVNTTIDKMKVEYDVTIGGLGSILELSIEKSGVEAAVHVEVSKIILNQTRGSLKGNGKIREVVVNQNEIEIWLNQRTKIDQVTVTGEEAILRGTAEIGLLNVEAAGITMLALSREPDEIKVVEKGKISWIYRSTSSVTTGDHHIFNTDYSDTSSKPQKVARISIVRNISIYIGDTIYLDAKALDDQGKEIKGVQFDYTIETAQPTNIVKVDPSGYVTGLAEGTIRVHVRTTNAEVNRSTVVYVTVKDY